MRVVLAGVAYAVACLFAGMLIESARNAIAPVIGETAAVVCEGMALLVAVFFSAKLATALLGERQGYSLAVGFEGFCAVSAADFLLGWLSPRLSLEAQLAALSTMPGLMYGCLLLSIMIMPVVTGNLSTERRGTIAALTTPRSPPANR